MDEDRDDVVERKDEECDDFDGVLVMFQLFEGCFKFRSNLFFVTRWNECFLLTKILQDFKSRNHRKN